MVEKTDGSGKERKWVGTGRPEEDMAQYTELGLTPCVTKVTAGDLILCEPTPLRWRCIPASHAHRQTRRIFIELVAACACHPRAVDTALYHAGCPAEDPSGLR